MVLTRPFDHSHFTQGLEFIWCKIMIYVTVTFSPIYPKSAPCLRIFIVLLILKYWFFFRKLLFCIRESPNAVLIFIKRLWNFGVWLKNILKSISKNSIFAFGSLYFNKHFLLFCKTTQTLFFYSPQACLLVCIQ